MEGDSLILRLYRTKLISSITYSQLYFLKRELKGCWSVLDIGCGCDSPLRHSRPAYAVGVDAHMPAITDAKKKDTHNAYIAADIERLEFRPGSFDAVVLCEVLEHLAKDHGKLLLDKAESWARKRILVSTPNGYLAQDALHGNPYQTHRSGWDIEEIEALGYKSYGLVGLRWKPSGFLFFPLFFWAVISVMLQNFTYYFPKIAFEVFYVKDKTSR